MWRAPVHRALLTFPFLKLHGLSFGRSVSVHLRSIRTSRTYGPYVRPVRTARTYGYDLRHPYVRPVRVKPYRPRRPCGVYDVRNDQGFIQTPQGVITPPPVFMRHPPNHLKFKEGYQGVFTGGGVYVIVMEWVINVVKY